MLLFTMATMITMATMLIRHIFIVRGQVGEAYYILMHGCGQLYDVKYVQGLWPLK